MRRKIPLREGSQDEVRSEVTTTSPLCLSAIPPFISVRLKSQTGGNTVSWRLCDDEEEQKPEATEVCDVQTAGCTSQHAGQHGVIHQPHAACQRSRISTFLGRWVTRSHHMTAQQRAAAYLRPGPPQTPAETHTLFCTCSEHIRQLQIVSTLSTVWV